MTTHTNKMHDAMPGWKRETDRRLAEVSAMVERSDATPLPPAPCIIERFPMSSRGWILCDPVHAQVRFEYQGHVFLGDVREVYFDGTTGVQRLRVHHFNGDRWPFDPPVRSVEVLVREWPLGEMRQ